MTWGGRTSVMALSGKALATSRAGKSKMYLEINCRTQINIRPQSTHPHQQGRQPQTHQGTLQPTVRTKAFTILMHHTPPHLCGGPSPRAPVVCPGEVGGGGDGRAEEPRHHQAHARVRHGAHHKPAHTRARVTRLHAKRTVDGKGGGGGRRRGKTP